jgi:hypothetical protein
MSWVQWAKTEESVEKSLQKLNKKYFEIMEMEHLTPVENKVSSWLKSNRCDIGLESYPSH